MLAFHTINKSSDIPRANKTTHNKAYKSYLLRLWREANSGRLLLRLQSVEQDTRVLSFTGLESFVAYLEDITGDFKETSSKTFTLFVRQFIQDADNWKRVFDEVSRLRSIITEARLYRGSYDPNQVTLMLQFRDLKAAKMYENSEKFRAVTNAEIWFAVDVERTAF